MNSQTARFTIAGPAGALDCALDRPDGEPRGWLVVCHPHPLHGGTLDNKVVQTVARAGLALGMSVLRFNFRGVAGSAGAWDEGRGEVDDALAVIEHGRERFGAGGDFALAGFSFGGYVAAAACDRLASELKPQRLALVAPSTRNHQAPAVPSTTLLVHGETDDVVPLAASLDWARPQGLPVVVVPGVGHFFHGALPQLKNIVLQAWRP